MTTTTMPRTREDLVRRVQLAATGADVHRAGSLIAGYRMTCRAARQGTATADQVARAEAALERFLLTKENQAEGKHG